MNRGIARQQVAALFHVLKEGGLVASRLGDHGESLPRSALPRVALGGLPKGNLRLRNTVQPQAAFSIEQLQFRIGGHAPQGGLEFLGRLLEHLPGFVRLPLVPKHFCLSQVQTAQKRLPFRQVHVVIDSRPHNLLSPCEIVLHERQFQAVQENHLQDARRRSPCRRRALGQKQLLRLQQVCLGLAGLIQSQVEAAKLKTAIERIG